MIDIILASFTKFNGIDWAAATLLLSGLWLVTDKRRIGFLVMITGCMLWVVHAHATGSVAQGVSNTIFACINLAGWWKWRKHTATH